MFRNIATIVAALVLLQVIGSGAKSLSFAKDTFNVSFSENIIDNIGISWKKYQSVRSIHKFIENLHEKFPNLTEITDIGQTYEKRALKVLRISENPETNKKIWVDGGIHAREWISTATVTYIMYQLLINWENQPEYMKNITWYFLPVMNPDGYEYSRHVERDWRKNRVPTSDPACFGVDLNRNFDIAWGTEGSTSNPCDYTYHGPKAGSELETQAVTKFLRKNKKNLVSYLSFHSYSQAIIYPWSYKDELIKDAADLKRVGELAAKRINARTGTDYSVEPGMDFSQLASGGSDDWSRAALKVKYSYTVELRDKGDHGFTLPPDQIVPTGQEGFIVVSTVAEAAKKIKF